MRKAMRTAVIGILLAALTGCGSLMHPRAGEYLDQAKGGSALETEVNLTHMVEATIKSLQGKPYDEEGFDRLHNQLYALKKAACQVTEAQAKTTAYAKTHVLRKEVGLIFHRLWKHREDPAMREMLLDLLARRVAELREALQAVRV